MVKILLHFMMGITFMVIITFMGDIVIELPHAQPQYPVWYCVVVSHGFGTLILFQMMSNTIYNNIYYILSINQKWMGWVHIFPLVSTCQKKKSTAGTALIRPPLGKKNWPYQRGGRTKGFCFTRNCMVVFNLPGSQKKVAVRRGSTVLT